MGYSCSAIAAATLDGVQAHCISQTGMQNVYQKNGRKYFFQTTRREHPDGSITGKVFKYVGDDLVQDAGSFKIDGDTGTIIRWSASPVSWKSMIKRFRELSNQIFNDNSFVESVDNKIQREYDQLFPHFAKLRQLGLA